MFWFILVVMVVVLGAAALIALGAGNSMPEAEPDRVVPALPEERPLNRADLDELRLPMALRGYRMSEVDEVLDRLGAEIHERDGRIAALELELAGARAGHGSWAQGASASGSAPSGGGPSGSGPSGSGPSAAPGEAAEADDAAAEVSDAREAGAAPGESA